MKNTAKQQAFADMSASGIMVSVLYYEKAILSLTITIESTRVDFRKYNGGYRPRKK